MIKLALLLKFGFIGTGALAFVVLAEAIGIESLASPHGWQLLFNGFVAGYALRGLLSSYVGGMVPPDDDSSRGYTHFYNSLQLAFHRSTPFLLRASALASIIPSDEGK